MIHGPVPGVATPTVSGFSEDPPEIPNVFSDASLLDGRLGVPALGTGGIIWPDRSLPISDEEHDFVPVTECVDCLLYTSDAADDM
eukprot:9122183-Alexandrium_andersonii.AAC.1